MTNEQPVISIPRQRKRNLIFSLNDSSERKEKYRGGMPPASITAI